MQRELESKLQVLESMITERQEQLEVSLLTKAVLEQQGTGRTAEGAAAAARAPDADSSLRIMPLGDTQSESWRPENSSHVSSRDGANRSFYQLLTGPYRLASTTDEDARSPCVDLATITRASANLCSVAKDRAAHVLQHTSRGTWPQVPDRPSRLRRNRCRCLSTRGASYDAARHGLTTINPPLSDAGRRLAGLWYGIAARGKGPVSKCECLLGDRRGLHVKAF